MAILIELVSNYRFWSNNRRWQWHLWLRCHVMKVITFISYNEHQRVLGVPLDMLPGRAAAPGATFVITPTNCIGVSVMALTQIIFYMINLMFQNDCNIVNWSTDCQILCNILIELVSNLMFQPNNTSTDCQILCSILIELVSKLNDKFYRNRCSRICKSMPNYRVL
jgi:hypothetical protein